MPDNTSTGYQPSVLNPILTYITSTMIDLVYAYHLLIEAFVSKTHRHRPSRSNRSSDSWSRKSGTFDDYDGFRRNSHILRRNTM
ncbi:hypothetical protein IWQ60_001777 [Tieghemiomyces parasiticus]|uniref:Uncharacterized protein n=1 Tax=Tieghemiomyces parasiticus TaxID=78921 RepID=A0A9W8DW94_9FUNG|nr:hypothetical protein IWQ60_001777 [Tieghemiomyces parasiticus]